MPREARLCKSLDFRVLRVFALGAPRERQEHTINRMCQVMRPDFWQAFRIGNRLNFGEHFTRNEGGKRLNGGRGKAEGQRFACVHLSTLGAPDVGGFDGREGGREGHTRRHTRRRGHTSGNTSKGGETQRNGARTDELNAIL